MYSTALTHKFDSNFYGYFIYGLYIYSVCARACVYACVCARARIYNKKNAYSEDSLCWLLISCYHFYSWLPRNCYICRYCLYLKRLRRFRCCIQLLLNYRSCSCSRNFRICCCNIGFDMLNNVKIRDNYRRDNYRCLLSIVMEIDDSLKACFVYIEKLRLKVTEASCNTYVNKCYEQDIRC